MTRASSGAMPTATRWAVCDRHRSPSPLARYGAAPEGSGCDPVRPGLGSPSIPMRRVPLARARLDQLYPGGKAEYLRRFDAAIDALVAQRWLRAPDAAAQKAEARTFAEEAFK
ncbi:alpha/beta hydrolase domain-containing protein [Sphingomonas sp. J315]|uniref:alpha/beta hydrolase domain-containing protein n=1 Tax=Sphingomonas sp. J315 TaxID=2898433 RepID=UPI0039175E52